jgi:Fatty acid hydroxylase superfamily
MAIPARTASVAARFLAHSAPRVEVGVLLLAVGTRACAAASGEPLIAADAALAGGMLAAMPFAEWLVHSRLLHAKPIAWRGRTLQSAAARAHEAHHADPRNERLVVTPAAALLPLLPVLALAAFLPSWGLRATAVAILAAAVLSSEWVHFLVHASPAPRSRWLRRRSHAHRLHHYRNDQYWFGLTTGLADAVMRTAPRRDACPVRRRPARASVRQAEAHSG